MNTTQTEISEAIALAKAVRQTALANAKVALEEQFSQKYEALFANKLKEEAGSIGAAPSATNDEPISEQDIDEIIKELESDISGEQTPPAPEASAEGEQTPPAPEASPEASAEGEQTPPAPITPPGATVPPNIPIVQAPVAVIAAPAAGELTPSPEGGKEDDINLDELLESLKKELEAENDKEEKLEEDKKLATSGIGSSDNKKPSDSAQSSSKIESGGLNDNGVPEGKTITKDATDAKRPNEAKNATSTNLSTPKLGDSAGPALKAARPNSKGSIENTATLKEDFDAAQQTINEQSQAINYLKNELNEINLLNAKLLYTNRLFKEHNINGEQKMRIVEMFDLSKNIREVKMTFANLTESLNFGGVFKKVASKLISTERIKTITEGIDIKASVGSTKPTREIISESAFDKARFQQLAGIKLQPTKK